MKVLLADDEPTLRITLSDDLQEAGYDVVAVEDGDAAIGILEKQKFDCVLTDLKMPGADGMAVLKRARETGAEVVVLTGAGTIESAVAAMKAGAFDYVQKPFMNDEILILLQRVARTIDMGREIQELKTELKGRQGFGGVVGSSQAMQKVFSLASAACESDATVIIRGESGCGKEVLSRAIHQESSRCDGAFVPVSCAILSDTLLEDELFGHEKGAFTDARTERHGRFEMADGGTLLLDDIDDMRLETQVKLLRVLQERVVERLGGTRQIPVNIRVIAATKIDLWDAVRRGEFREDLFHRLNVIQINLPPLRERPEDIPLLVSSFIDKHAPGEGLTVSASSLDAMMKSPWEGNVRQLENSVCRAVALRGSESELPLEYLLQGVGESQAAEPTNWSLSEVVRDAEREHIRRALGACGDNRTRAAELLGISRKNLWEKMKSLGVQ